MTTTTTVRFVVTRDSATAWRDEDRAMAHVLVASKLGTFEEAKEVLVNYMNQEVEWLTTKFVSASSLRRAADILDGVNTVRNILSPETNKALSQVQVETCGLVWSIIRTERQEVTA
jgi:hypothetical protein